MGSNQVDFGGMTLPESATPIKAAAGVAKSATVVGVKVLSDSGSGYTSSVISGMHVMFRLKLTADNL